MVVLHKGKTKNLAAAFQLSANDYPIISAEYFKQIFTDVPGVPQSALNRWFEHMAFDIQMNGQSASLLVFSNGNAMKYNLEFDQSSRCRVYFDKEFFKKDAYDVTKYKNIVTGAEKITTKQDSSGKDRPYRWLIAE